VLHIAVGFRHPLARQPHESPTAGAFSEAVPPAREPSAGKVLRRVLEELKPEAVYFTEMEGKRTAVEVGIAADLGSTSVRTRSAPPAR
jgi:hypothetical protein